MVQRNRSITAAIGRYSHGLDMKIPGSDAVDNKKSRASEQLPTRRPTVDGGVGSAGSNGSAAQSKGDSIKVSSLGALMQSELNPAKMAEERAQKIAALKEQIKNGTYSPDSSAVARSLGEEIYLEIALGGDLKD